MVGTDAIIQKNVATMNFGWFDVATTIHEFGHVLGMIHEHQNPYGKNIDWNIDEVYRWASDTQNWDKKTVDNNIIRKYDTNQINGSVFDSSSIMLYFFPAFLTLDHIGTNENLRLSKYDVLYINHMYPGGPESPKKFYEKVYNETIDEEEVIDINPNPPNINIYTRSEKEKSKFIFKYH